MLQHRASFSGSQLLQLLALMASYPQYQPAPQQAAPQPPAYTVSPLPTGQAYPAAMQPAYDPNTYAPVPAAAYTAAPAPHYTTSPGQAPYGQPYNRDEPRTVFVTGFPQDAKERELINMCRFMPGYEARPFPLTAAGDLFLSWPLQCKLVYWLQAASMKRAGAAPQGFVLFVSGAAAHGAVSMLNGCECVFY